MQGPPGTGKTTFGEALLYFLIWITRHSSEEKVLLTSSTNVGVDNLLTRFRTDRHGFSSAFGRTFSSNPVEIRRYGRRVARGYEGSLSDILLDSICTSQVSEEIDYGRYQEELDAAELLVGTLGSIGLGKLVPLQIFDTCVLEENGQTWEVETVQALMRSCHGILIGDQNQLKRNVKNQSLKGSNFDTSAMERLALYPGISKCVLVYSK